MRRFLRRTVSVLLASFALSIQVSAHHSPNVHFNRNDEVEIDGTLRQIEWTNPHVQLTIATFDENGDEVVWQVEDAGLNAMERRGVSKDDYTIDAPIRVAGFRGRRNRTALFATNTLLADGRELLGGLASGRRWPSSDLVWDPGANQTTNDQPADNTRGLFRVWSMDPSAQAADGTGRVLWKDSYPLTEEARAIQSTWDSTADNPFIFCRNAMPAIMDSNLPMEISQSSDEILIRFEEQDVIRRIYLGADSADVEPGPYGHSTGRIEEDVLIVTTTDIDFPWFDQAGIPQSEALELVERFSVSADERYLNYSVTATDPAIFDEPVVLEKRWMWVPGEEVKPYQCSYDRNDL